MLAVFAVGYSRISSPTSSSSSRTPWPLEYPRLNPVMAAAAALCRMIHKFSRDPVLGISPSPLAVPDTGKTGRLAVFSRRSFEANPHGGSRSIDSQSACRRADVVQC